MRAADSFHFQQFRVSQDRCAMKVGTDGVLLGAWASLPVKSAKEPVNILDIGTGTGLIALMVAQRLAHAGQAFQITALEPEPLAAAQARQNIVQSAWAKHMQVQTQSIAPAPLGPADLWVCNPPFFEQKRISAQQERAQARHSGPGFIGDFFARANECLSAQGHIALVLPQDREDVYVKAAQDAGWHRRKRCEVRHSEQHPVKRVLLEFERSASAVTETQTLCLKEMGPEGWQDTAAYARYVAPFYLRYLNANPAPTVLS